MCVTYNNVRPLLTGRAAFNAANSSMDSSGRPSTAQIVVLATSSALTAIFYSIYKNRATTVARLKVSHFLFLDVAVSWFHVTAWNCSDILIVTLVYFRKPRKFPSSRI